MGEFFKGWRRSAVRMVICAVLVLAVYGALLVWVPYQREQRIAKEIKALGGRAFFGCVGPHWVPLSVQYKVPLFSRVTVLDEYYHPLNDTDLKYLLEHLKGLSNLISLSLANTQVTDADLEHLKGLATLRELDLENTNVTPDGRAMLRKALPNCRISPVP